MNATTFDALKATRALEAPGMVQRGLERLAAEPVRVRR